MLAEAAFAAKLRHELEHARQWNACGEEPFRLATLAHEVQKRKMGGKLYGAFLNQLPIEDDANSAAAVFVRKVRPESVAELASHDAYAFLFHYRGIIEEMAVGLPAEDYLRMWAPSAVNTWVALSKQA